MTVTSGLQRIMMPREIGRMVGREVTVTLLAGKIWPASEVSRTSQVRLTFFADGR